MGAPLARQGWQDNLLRYTFARDPATERRLFRTAMWSMGRKNGKSGLVAPIAIDGLFDEDGAEVYSCAADKEQARLVFAPARKTVELVPELNARLRLYKDAIENPANGSVYRVLSSEAYTKEGLSPTLVICDELHAWPNRDLYDVMALAMGARYDPLMLIVTTAGIRTDTTGGDSICFQLYQYGRQIVSGEIEDPTFFFADWEPDPKLDIESVAYQKQANPGYGTILDPAEIAQQARKAKHDPQAEPQFRIKRGNQWVNTAVAALPIGVWERRRADRDLRPGERVVLFLDGSYSGDSTGLVACTLDGFLDVIGAWEKPPRDPEWRVDIGAVELAVQEACKTYDVAEVCCDPFRWQRSMQALAAMGLPIVEYNTGHPSRMVPAWAKFYDAVTQRHTDDGGAPRALAHSGDPRLTRHIYNIKIKIDTMGPRPVKEHKMSPRKIDLAICAVGAFDRATFLAGTPTEESMYETHRLQVFG